MTGVAAALTGRRAVLNDLSPAAVHIAGNYTTPCDPNAFRAAVQRVLGAVGAEVASLYETLEAGRPAIIEYLVWSDVRACPGCGVPQLLWDHRTRGLRTIRCHACGIDVRKPLMPFLGEQAVEASISLDGRRLVRPVVAADLETDRLPREIPWHPTTPFTANRPMWRKGHEDLQIRTVADFYSRRNLAALALLWGAAADEQDERLRSALRFSLTAIANRASRRYQWNEKRPTNVLGGTLYVSSLRYEWNVLSLWRRKVAAVERLFRENPMPEAAVAVHCGSAVDLPLANSTADYCFTDPPFGSHIVYSDSSLLWEAWLDDLMDREAEAIIVTGGDLPKGATAYRDLLRQSFAEVRRVLKPGRVATVVFQATDSGIWLALQEAARDAGLGLVDATTLDKGQPSFKQVKGQADGERVARTDVVLTFGSGVRAAEHPVLTPLDAAREAIGEAGDHLRPTTTGPLYAAINARLLRDGPKTTLSYEEVSVLLAASFVQARNGWAIAA